MHQVMFSFDNVINNGGISLALSGMAIVFVALALVSCYIALIPKIAGFCNKIVPPTVHREAPKPASRAVQDNQTEAEIVAAAVAYLQKNKS
ncbi:OadG family protein [Maridesulfovibrio bastinii]|uniref:OadG family protein n=1 Tax=Maridesulfovibrio bastinii TaxID=47157 RepID=UPI000424C098|nr:OadG family protein [Maridesulfovibrio bastinii]